MGAQLQPQLQPLPPWLGLDERKAPRWPVDWPTSFSSATDGIGCDARMLDLSTDGCLLAVRGPMTVGRYLRVMLPHGIEAGGWVAWTRAERVGLTFANPLPAAMVEHIASERSRRAA